MIIELREELIDHLWRVDTHEPAEETASFPATTPLCGICQALRTPGADTYMPVRLDARMTRDVVHDLRFSQVG
jgi:hypothetical protein